LRELAKTFPGDFRIWDLGPLDSEGGDLEIVWLPEGRAGLLIGRHRVRNWLASRYGEAVLGRRLESARIEEAREAYGRAFFGMRVLIAGEEGLRDPGLVSDDLFHADMVVNILRSGKTALAFVPSYGKNPVDLLLEKPLS